MLLPLNAAAYWSQGQYVGFPATGTPPVSTIPANGSVVSNVINTNGQSRGSVCLQSTAAGVLTVTLYADSAGMCPLAGGSPAAQALTANTAATVGWATEIPCGSIKVTVTNTTGAVATLTNIAVNLQP